MNEIDDPSVRHRISGSASKENKALLVIDPYKNEFISEGPPSIDNRTARIGTGEVCSAKIT